MIAATDDGISSTPNRSWSIDDKRLNFQFGCEIGWEIKNGKQGGWSATRPTPASAPFWQSLDMLGNESEWTFWGTPNCGKGQPGQIGHTAIPRSRAGSAAFGWGARMSAPMDVCERVLARVDDGSRPR